MNRPPRVRKRSSFNAGMVLLILAAFSYANDLLGPQEAVFWGGAGLFWLWFSFRRGDSPKERENAAGRRAFYNRYFGPFAFFAPSIPYLLLLVAFLLMQFAPSVRWAVWTLLGIAAAYLIAICCLMTRFLRRWRRERRELAARIPPPQPPWDGADGVL